MQKQFLHKDKQNQTITIIGGGLAGAFLALLLAKRGFRVQIFEKLSEEEYLNANNKRSFNLTFHYRGVAALQKAGLWNSIKHIFIKLDGTVIHPKNKKPVFSKFDFNNKPYYGVQRITLLQFLYKKILLYKNVSYYFSSELIWIDIRKKKIIIRNKTSGTLKTIATEIVIGADGVNSMVRSFLQKGQNAFLKQEYEAWEYKEIVFNKRAVKELALRVRCMQIWTRENAIITALPNKDNSFSGMLILPKNVQASFSELKSSDKIQNFLQNNFPELVPISSEIINSIKENPVGRLVSITADPWYFKDFLVILGDAAHGALPFYGQGVSAAFEDCLDLISLIDKHGTQWQKILPLFQKARKEHDDVLVQLSKDNFIRYRKLKSVDFDVIMDSLDSLFHALFPKFWLPPLYVLIYTEAEGFADILKKHQKRRKTAKWLGIPILASMIYVLLSIKSKILRKN